MNDTEFNERADAVLAKIEQALDDCGADLDYSRLSGGVLEIELDSGKVIVNHHAVSQEIWVAARSGGFHFQWDGVVWRDSRSHAELMAALSLLLSEEAGEAINLA